MIKGDKTMKVIANGDDFGFSKGVNLGILEAFQNGIVSQTSLMVNMPGFDHAVELMRQYPDLLKVGIHLVTSVQYSITEGNKTITDENNKFYHDHDKIKNCDFEELKNEYEAQLLKFLETGFKPTHIDFHWCYYPVQVEAAMYLSKKYDLPVRTQNKEMEDLFTKEGIKHNINMISDFYSLDASVTTDDKMMGLLQRAMDANMEQCSFELHPAYVDQWVLTLSSYNIQRTRELQALTSPKLVQFVKDSGIELISFADL